MKIGMKIYSNQPEKVPIFSEFADFIEVLIIPGESIKPLLDFDVPYRVHAAHQGFGVNLADASVEGFSRKSILESMRVAEELNSPTVIIHPGAGDKAQALKLLEEFPSLAGDTQLLLENLPKISDKNHLMNFAGEAQAFLDLGYGLCLDIGHAAGAAAALNKDYEQIILNFMKFNPNYFHVSNGITESTYDLHMPLRQGDFDLSFFKKQILKTLNPFITLETPFDLIENKKEFVYFKEVL